MLSTMLFILVCLACGAAFADAVEADSEERRRRQTPQARELDRVNELGKRAMRAPGYHPEM